MGKVEPGKRFEGKLKDSLEKAGAYVMRIPDKVYWTGRRVVSEETPADFFGCYIQRSDGTLHSYLIEAKACSKHRISFDRLQEHQRAALLDFDSLHENCHGYVAVNYYDSVSLNRLDVCFMVPIATWEALRTAEGAMKSLSHEECLDAPGVIFCNKVQGAVYDMERLLKG